MFCLSSFFALLVFKHVLMWEIGEQILPGQSALVFDIASESVKQHFDM